MDTKFLSYTGLQEYDDLIKCYVDAGLGKKAPSTHTHDDRYYTESEIDNKLSAINTSVDKITSGETVVSKATSATYASTATNATNAATASYAQTAENATNASTANFAKKATNADTATYATNAGTATFANSADLAAKATNADTATYAKSAGTASKLGTTTVGSATQPIYLNAGSATTCTTYAGGTKLTVNGSNKGGSSAAIYAPTTGGTSGYILKSAGTAAPVWAELDAYTKAEVDTALSNKSASTHNHDTKYDAKGASTAALSQSKTYTDEKIALLLNNSSEAVDSIMELATAMKDNADAIDALETIASNKADKATYEAHAGSTVVHITDAERTAWNAKASTAAATTSTAGLVKLTNSVASTSTTTAATPNSVKQAYDLASSAKSAATAVQTSLDTHVANTSAHVSTTERTNWNAAYNHSTVAHAPSNAEKNQNAFSNIKVGSTTVAADTTTDTVEFVGENITITPDATNDKITFKVDAATTAALGLVKSGSTVTSTSGLTASPIIGGIPYYKNTTYSNATTGTAGLMTAADKAKLDGIAEGANKITVDTALSSTSTNPVQNKVVNSAISTLTSAVSTNTSSISTLTSAIEAIEEISKTEIEALFA